MENAAGKFNDSNGQGEELKIAVNSMQRTAFVERMAIPEHVRMNRRDIVSYDLDNFYPNKAKSIAERSGSTMTAIETLSSFTVGSGFEDENSNDLVVNSEGQTLYDILSHVGNEKAMFRGYALHFNYNILGQIVEINEISFENIRWNYDQTQLVWCKDWRKVRGGNNKNTIRY